MIDKENEWHKKHQRSTRHHNRVLKELAQLKQNRAEKTKKFLDHILTCKTGQKVCDYKI